MKGLFSMKRNIIPPPLVFISCGLLIWLFNRWMPGGAIMATIKPLGYLVILVGLAINIAGVVTFRKAGTTINPLQPDKATLLVTHNVFARTRNPMYLAMAIMLTGAAILFGSLLGLVVVAFFVIYITQFQIKPEEEAMREIFGAGFDAYCAKVRRWI
jgi:protein-S-isoprenylcysteine O-methyltransferase Ste14